MQSLLSLSGNKNKLTVDKPTLELEQKAKSGNAKDLLKLGVRYLLSEDKELVPKGYQLCKDAADKNNLNAKYVIALCLYHGWGILKDTKQGIDINYQAAEAGHEGAMLTAGTRDFFPDMKKSMEKVKELANAGDPFAQLRIAVCCETGHLAVEDAFEWYLKCAEQGCFPAFFKLARHYYDGRGVTRDFVRSVYWYEKSAKMGEASACWNLGLLYQTGKPGVEKNAETAFKWFLEGANGGHINCMNQVATCYLDGDGVPENPEKAVEYFRIASSKKHQEATYKLGILYEKGIAVEQDWAMALELYNIASLDMKVAGESKKALQKKIQKMQESVTRREPTQNTSTTTTSTSAQLASPSFGTGSKYSFRSIEELLEHLNYFHYLPTLKKEEIDLEALSLLSVRDLNSIGIKMGEAAKLLKAINAPSLNPVVHISDSTAYHGYTGGRRLMRDLLNSVAVIQRQASQTPLLTEPGNLKQSSDLRSSGVISDQVRKSREKYQYDVFLSHKQANGADLAQSIKLQLLDRDPSLRIFLDVDDLHTIHNLEQLVADTQHFVLLITEGVLERPYVKLEIKSALKLNKHIILVHDERNCMFPSQHECDPEIRDVLLPLAVPYYRAKAFRDTSMNMLFTQLTSL